MKRQNLFRKMRGIPDRVLGQALGNHQQNLQMLVASHGQLRHGVVLVGRIAIAALVVAVVALIVAVVR